MVVSALDLASDYPRFKPRSNHLLNLLWVVISVVISSAELGLQQ